MTRVYLTEQGSFGHKRGGRLEVDKDGLSLLRLPLEQVEQVVVVGRGVQLSTALLVDLIQRGIEVAFLSRSGRYYGQAAGAPNGATTSRAAQYAFLGDTGTATAFVRAVVTQKLAAQAQQLAALADAPAIVRIARAGEEVAHGRNIDQLRGHEGAAAAAYWQAIGRAIPAAWGFPGRRHHPAPDPVNALLSFGYTLLLQEIVSAVHLVGLDAYLGALHTPDPGRPSLALDLEEPLRPLGVDAWVLAAVLDGTFRPAQFFRDGERALLTPEGRRQFLALYNRQMERRVRHPLAPGRIGLRQAIELHVRAAAQLFLGARPALEAIQWP